jgi:hypothetical protein
MSVQHAAEALALPPNIVADAIRAGTLPAYSSAPVGGVARSRVLSSDLEKWVREHWRRLLPLAGNTENTHA